MNQTTLPVIILKNIILFPSGEIRLELENESDKEILNLAETYYEKHILIVHQTDFSLSEPPRYIILCAFVTRS